ncbi:MAG: hypothetical protein ACT4P2_00495 [Pseudomonadota bacterium]
MRKLLLVAVIAAIGFLPAAARAQQQNGDILGLNSTQVIAIGLGVAGGVIILEGLFGAPVAVAALTGGLVGNWWYSQQGEQVRQAAVKKSASLVREAQALASDVQTLAADTATGAYRVLASWTPEVVR